MRKKRLAELLWKRGSKFFKRFGQSKRSLPKSKEVVNAEIMSTGVKAGDRAAGGGIIKYGSNGIQKISKNEAAVYNRFNKGRRAVTAKRRSLFGANASKKIVERSASNSKFFGKAAPYLKKGAGFVLGTGAWFAAETLLEYAWDKFTGEDEAEDQLAAEDAAREAIASITKTGALEDALGAAGIFADGTGVSEREGYYRGSELVDQADLIERMMYDLNLHATGDLINQMDKAIITAMSHYTRGELLMKLVNVIKALTINSSAPELFLLLARQGMCSSLDAVGWTESFESLINKDDVESVASESIAAEYNVMYEAFYEEQRIGLADTYFNEVTDLVNLKSDRSSDFVENEATADGQLAKKRFALSSMVTDDSFADVEGWWDKLRVNSNNAKDDEALAAGEMLRYSTLGSLYIAQFVAAVQNNSHSRRNMLSR